MKRIKYLIHRWIRRIKYWIKSKTNHTTYKGYCLGYYIIQKYINQTKPDDYNAAYEEFISLAEEPFFHTHLYEEIDDRTSLRRWAALFVLTHLMAYSDKEMYMKLYNAIEDDEVHEAIIYLIQTGRLL